MHVCIIHYHLNRGGVTRVIESHLRALAAGAIEHIPARVTILHGGRALGWNSAVTSGLPFEVALQVIPALDYDDQSPADPDQIVLRIQQSLAMSDKDGTVLHIHNHSLGKNSAFPRAICKLADAGWRLLLHIHDFAEDLRPGNYAHMCSQNGGVRRLQPYLYPQAPHIHYATLNERDYHRLVDSGIDKGRLHLLPNPVSAVSLDVPREVAKKTLFEQFGIPPDRIYVLYPVRAIGRKNIGEFLLWSLLVDNAVFAVTLSPLNANERKLFEYWRTTAESLSLPVHFGVGESGGLTLEENYAAADAVITTSVAEGFGLVFLEAALAERPLFGRNLPGVTDDFRAAGLAFPGLVDEIQVPAQLVDVDELQRRFFEWIQELRTSFGMVPTNYGDLRQPIQTVFEGATIDFGRLDSKIQETILRRVSNQTELRAELRDLNPVVKSVGRSLDPSPSAKEAFAANRRAISEAFSFPTIGAKLGGTYRSLLDSKADAVDRDASVAQMILEGFVHPSQLFPIRLE